MGGLPPLARGQAPAPAEENARAIDEAKKKIDRLQGELLAYEPGLLGVAWNEARIRESEFPEMPGIPAGWMGLPEGEFELVRYTGPGNVFTLKDLDRTVTYRLTPAGLRKYAEEVVKAALPEGWLRGSDNDLLAISELIRTGRAEEAARRDARRRRTPEEMIEVERLLLLGKEEEARRLQPEGEWRMPVPERTAGGIRTLLRMAEDEEAKAPPLRDELRRARDELRRLEAERFRLAHPELAGRIEKAVAGMDSAGRQSFAGEYGDFKKAERRARAAQMTANEPGIGIETSRAAAVIRRLDTRRARTVVLPPIEIARLDDPRIPEVVVEEEAHAAETRYRQALADMRAWAAYAEHDYRDFLRRVVRGDQEPPADFRRLFAMDPLEKEHLQARPILRSGYPVPYVVEGKTEGSIRPLGAFRHPEPLDTESPRPAPLYYEWDPLTYEILAFRTEEVDAELRAGLTPSNGWRVRLPNGRFLSPVAFGAEFDPETYEIVRLYRSGMDLPLEPRPYYEILEADYREIRDLTDVGRRTRRALWGDPSVEAFEKDGHFYLWEKRVGVQRGRVWDPALPIDRDLGGQEAETRSQPRGLFNFHTKNEIETGFRMIRPTGESDALRPRRVENAFVARIRGGVLAPPGSFGFGERYLPWEDPRAYVGEEVIGQAEEDQRKVLGQLEGILRKTTGDTRAAFRTEIALMLRENRVPTRPVIRALDEMAAQIADAPGPDEANPIAARYLGILRVNPSRYILYGVLQARERAWERYRTAVLGDRDAEVTEEGLEGLEYAAYLAEKDASGSRLSRRIARRIEEALNRLDGRSSYRVQVVPMRPPVRSGRAPEDAWKTRAADALFATLLGTHRAAVLVSTEWKGKGRARKKDADAAATAANEFGLDRAEVPVEVVLTEALYDESVSVERKVYGADDGGPRVKRVDDVLDGTTPLVMGWPGAMSIGLLYEGDAPVFPEGRTISVTVGPEARGIAVAPFRGPRYEDELMEVLEDLASELGTDLEKLRGHIGDAPYYRTLSRMLDGEGIAHVADSNSAYEQLSGYAVAAGTPLADGGPMHFMMGMGDTETVINAGQVHLLGGQSFWTVISQDSTGGPRVRTMRRARAYTDRERKMYEALGFDPYRTYDSDAVFADARNLFFYATAVTDTKALPGGGPAAPKIRVRAGIETRVTETRVVDPVGAEYLVRIRERAPLGARTGADLREVREFLGMTPEEFGLALKTSPPLLTGDLVSQLETGKIEVPPWVMEKAEELAKSVTGARLTRKEADQLRRIARQVVDLLMDEFGSEGGAVSIDGLSAAGKSTLAAMIRRRLLQIGRHAVHIRLDGLLTDPEWRAVFRKRLVGGKLDASERKILYERSPIPLEALKRIRPKQTYTGEEEIYFLNDRILRDVLRKLGAFFKSKKDSETLTVRVYNPATRKTDRLVSYELRKDTIAIVDGKYANREPFARHYRVRMRVQADPKRVLRQFTAERRATQPRETADLMVESYPLLLGPSFEENYAPRTEGIIRVVIDLRGPRWRMIDRRPKGARVAREAEKVLSREDAEAARRLGRELAAATDAGVFKTLLAMLETSDPRELYRRLRTGELDLFFRSAFPWRVKLDGQYRYSAAHGDSILRHVDRVRNYAVALGTGDLEPEFLAGGYAGLPLGQEPALKAWFMDLLKGVDRHDLALYVLAALLHDVAILIRDDQHEWLGVLVADEILSKLGLPERDRELVLWLIDHHSNIGTMYLRETHPRALQLEHLDAALHDVALRLLVLHTAGEIRALPGKPGILVSRPMLDYYAGAYARARDPEKRRAWAEGLGDERLKFFSQDLQASEKTGENVLDQAKYAALVGPNDGHSGIVDALLEGPAIRRALKEIGNIPYGVFFFRNLDAETFAKVWLVLGWIHTHEFPIERAIFTAKVSQAERAARAWTELLRDWTFDELRADLWGPQTIKRVLRIQTDPAKAKVRLDNGAVLALGARVVVEGKEPAPPAAPAVQGSRSAYAQKSGRLNPVEQEMNDLLVAYLERHGLNSNEADAVANTLVRIPGPTIEVLEQWGVLLPQETGYLHAKTEAGNQGFKQNVLQTPGFAQRIRSLLQDHASYTGPQRRVLRQRLIPRQEVQKLQQQGIPDWVIFIALQSRFEIIPQATQAQAWVTQNQAAVGGTANAWHIVIRQGLQGAGSFMTQAQAWVTQNQAAVGGTANAWHIVIRQGLEGASAWVIQMQPQAQALIESGKSPASAWAELIASGARIVSTHPLPANFDEEQAARLEAALESLWDENEEIVFSEIGGMMSFMEATMAPAFIEQTVSNPDALRTYIEANNGTTWAHSPSLDAIAENYPALEYLGEVFGVALAEEASYGVVARFVDGASMFLETEAGEVPEGPILGAAAEALDAARTLVLDAALERPNTPEAAYLLQLAADIEFFEREIEDGIADPAYFPNEAPLLLQGLETRIRGLSGPQLPAGIDPGLVAQLVGEDGHLRTAAAELKEYLDRLPEEGAPEGSRLRILDPADQANYRLDQAFFALEGFDEPLRAEIAARRADLRKAVLATAEVQPDYAAVSDAFDGISGGIERLLPRVSEAASDVTPEKGKVLARAGANLRISAAFLEAGAGEAVREAERLAAARTRRGARTPLPPDTEDKLRMAAIAVQDAREALLDLLQDARYAERVGAISQLLTDLLNAVMTLHYAASNPDRDADQITEIRDYLERLMEVVPERSIFSELPAETYQALIGDEGLLREAVRYLREISDDPTVYLRLARNALDGAHEDLVEYAKEAPSRKLSELASRWAAALSRLDAAIEDPAAGEEDADDVRRLLEADLSQVRGIEFLEEPLTAAVRHLRHAVSGARARKLDPAAYLRFAYGSLTSAYGTFEAYRETAGEEAASAADALRRLIVLLDDAIERPGEHRDRIPGAVAEVERLLAAVSRPGSFPQFTPVVRQSLVGDDGDLRTAADHLRRFLGPSAPEGTPPQEGARTPPRGLRVTPERFRDDLVPRFFRPVAETNRARIPADGRIAIALEVEPGAEVLRAEMWRRGSETALALRTGALEWTVERPYVLPAERAGRREPPRRRGDAEGRGLSQVLDYMEIQARRGEWMKALAPADERPRAGVVSLELFANLDLENEENRALFEHYVTILAWKNLRRGDLAFAGDSELVRRATQIAEALARDRKIREAGFRVITDGRFPENAVITILHAGRKGSARVERDLAALGLAGRRGDVFHLFAEAIPREPDRQGFDAAAVGDVMAAVGLTVRKTPDPRTGRARLEASAVTETVLSIWKTVLGRAIGAGDAARILDGDESLGWAHAFGPMPIDYAQILNVIRAMMRDLDLSA
jgi:fructose-1,6-bisphosphatase/sedoheptulose 1,7-bisphosphatase-like protein